MANDLTVPVAQPCRSQGATPIGRERPIIGICCIRQAVDFAKDQLLERRAGVNIGGSQLLETEHTHG